jgi:hypothetical protein
VTPPSLSTLRQRVGLEPLIVAVMALALLLPAFWNGYPFVFSDTGEYLARSRALEVPSYRTIGYSLWIAAMGPNTTLWATVAAQSLLLAALMRLAARALVPRLPVAALLGGTLAIALLTAASTRASQLMPDVFAPILVLSLYLVVAHWSRLGTLARIVCVFGTATSVIMHATHVALGAGLLLVYAFGVARGGQPRRTGWRDVWRGALCVTAGVAILLGFNFAQTRRVFLTRNSHVFMLSHLVESGLATRLLLEECPQGARYDLCPWLTVILEKGPRIRPDEFAWNPRSPLYSIGGWEGSRDEASRILRGTLRKYPVSHAMVAAGYTFDQLAAISTLDGLESYARVFWVDGYIFIMRKGDYKAMHESRQQRATLGFFRLSKVHEQVAVLAAAASLWLLFWPRRRRASPDLASTAGFHRTVWLVLLGNAVLCGNMSGIYPRYQVRLVWLLPMAALLSAASWYWGRRHAAAATGEPAPAPAADRALEPALVA